MLRYALPALAAAACAVIPASASAQAFEGEYLALQAGVSILKTKGEVISGPLSESDTKPVVVAVAGFRGPIGENSPIVLGIEGDIGLTIDEFDSRFGVSGIAGFKAGERTLIYGRGGYLQRGGVERASGGSSVGGWMAGAGVEFAAFGDFNMRVDYRYADLGSDTDVLGFSRNFKSHELMAGAVFDF